MSLFRSIFQFFWIACCAVSMMVQTRLLLGFSSELDWLDGFVFGGTIFGYHFTNPNRYYRLLAWWMGVLAGICFLMATPVNFGVHWIGLSPVILWLAYYGFQKPGNKGLRGHTLAKPLTIALTWAWVTVLLPTPLEQWPELLFLLPGRTAFIFALALAYDLSDAAYDKSHGLTTLAGQLGNKGTLNLINSSLAFSGLCVGTNVIFHIYDYANGAALMISLIISAAWLRYMLQKKHWETWHKPLIDGLMVLQFLLVWICNV